MVQLKKISLSSVLMPWLSCFFKLVIKVSNLSLSFLLRIDNLCSKIDVNSVKPDGNPKAAVTR
jgi:hypothetical protein